MVKSKSEICMVFEIYLQTYGVGLDCNKTIFNLKPEELDEVCAGINYEVQINAPCFRDCIIRHNL